MQYVFFCVFPRRLRFKNRRFGTLYLFHLPRLVKQEIPSPRRLRFKSRRFGTLYRFHLPRQVKEEFFLHLPMKMEPIEGSETSAFKPQKPVKYPKENILYTLLLFRSGSLAHSVNVIPKLQEGLSRNRT